jgi:hypothetical protein
MKNQPALNWLIPLIGILTLIAAGAGLLWPKDGSPFTFTTIYGETAQMAGQGLYEHDTLFNDAAFRGTDIVTLFAVLPLLAVSFWTYHRGSLRGGFLLAGALAYLFYYGASRGLGTAYNSLFLIYIALFAATFFAFVLALTAFDLPALPERISPRLPRRGLAVFVFVAGLGTAFIWLSDAVAALLENRAPDALGTHTTVTTYTLDVGIIVPAALLAGILLLRRAPLGYLLSAVLTIMLALIGLMVIWQTIVQVNAGIVFSPGELIGKVVSWIIMGLIAIGLSISFLRNLAESRTGGSATARVAPTGDATRKS